MLNKSIRRVLLAATAVAVASLAGSAFAAKVAVITPYMAQPGTQAYVEAFQAVAKDKGWDVNVIDTQNDVAAVISRIQDMVTQKVDAIVVNVDPAQITAGLQAAKDANIPVIGMDAGADPLLVTNVTSNGYAMAAETSSYVADRIGGKGNVVMFVFDAFPPVQARGVVASAVFGNYPDIKIIDTYYHQETPEQAAAEVQRQQAAHPEIQGWAMIGGWPLFTRDALKWEPGTVKVVSVDALPAQLSYLQDGHVQVLLGQDCDGWGYKSVQMLLDKIVKNQDPPSKRVIDPLTKVTKENAAEFAKKWDKWLGK